MAHETPLPACLHLRRCHQNPFIMAAGVWLPMGPLAGDFKLQALPAAYFGWLVSILVGYGLLTTLMKRLYIRRYGWR